MKIQNHLAIPEKRILIVGNRSYRNMWDELILLWTVKLLLNQEKKITIAAYNPQRLKEFLSQFIDTKKVTFVTELPKGIRSWIRYIIEGKYKERKLYRKIDAVIIGWGEIITEENKNSYRYRIVSLLPCLRKPRYLMGGIQLPKKYINRLLFKRILKDTKNIFARDQETVDELSGYGYKYAEFFMDTSYFAYDRKKNRQNPSDKRYIIVNLNKNAEKFLPDIIQEVKKLYNQWYSIMYIPVAKGNNQRYDDMRYAQKIQLGAEIKDQRFTILDREKDFWFFVKTLAQASMVISSRLHLFLIASFLGVPTKVYPYQKKIIKMQKTLETLEIRKE